jgi:multicomponent Na+:H+ antiporter subunit D
MPLSVAVPLVAAALLAVVRRPARPRRIVLLGTLGLLLVHHVVLLVATADGTVLAARIGGWPGGVAITFVIDTFSALILVATSLLALVCVWFAVAAGEDERPLFAPLILVLVAGVAGVLLTGDLFNMFVFLEVALMPSYALMSMSSDRARFAAGRLFVSISLLTSTVFLIAVGLVYGIVGTVDLASLAGAAAGSPPLAAAGAVLLAALAVKSALVPVHGWLAETYPHASPA